MTLQENRRPLLRASPPLLLQTPGLRRTRGVLERTGPGLLRVPPGLRGRWCEAPCSALRGSG